MKAKKMRLFVLVVSYLLAFGIFFGITSASAETAAIVGAKILLDYKFATGEAKVVVDQQAPNLTAALVNGKVFLHIVQTIRGENEEILISDELKNRSVFDQKQVYIPSKEYFKTRFKGHKILMLFLSPASPTTGCLYIYYQ